MGRHRPATTRSQPWRLVCVAMVASVLNVPASTQTRSSADARAAISGRVIDEFGDPVIRGHVIVEVQTAPGATRQIAAADADDRGEYRIGLLPAGDYLVSVLTVDAVFITPQAIVFGSRSGPPQKMYYPGTRDSSDAEPLRIKAGEERDRIDFVLPAPAPPLLLPPAVEARRQADGVPAPGGSAIIRGRVVASDGRGLPRAHLRLVPNGDAVQTRIATADSEGRFEFRNVDAGTARVFALKPGYDPTQAEKRVEIAAGETADEIVFRLTRWSALSGRVLDDENRPIAGASVQTLQLRYEGGRRRLVPAGAGRLTNDLGRFRLYGLAPGQYVVSAAISGGVGADVPGYARTYYPGTANPAGAQFVAIGTAQDIDGIDIPLTRTRTARVAGKVVNAAGQPANPGSLSLVSSVRSASAVNVAIGARLAGDGSFEFPNVPAGQYVIRADRGRSPSWVEGEFATLPVTVDGADVTGLIVQTSAGSSITGRITFNSRDQSKVPPPSSFELRPLAVDFDAAPSSVATARIHDDWTFEMAGVNGPRRLDLTRLPDGWALQDIRAGGIAVTDRPLAFGRREQSLAGVEVIVTDRITELHGTVVAAEPHAEAPAVIVFATDRSRWYPASRFMRKTTAGPDGAFSVAALPFGSYYVAAVGRLPFNGVDDWQDPAFLETLVFQASTVTLAEERKVTIKLEVRH